MAKFEGVKWASRQLRFLLDEKKVELLEGGARVYAVSRSIHYGLFLTFEGIRFFCKKDDRGRLHLNFLNWYDNLERFRRGISFNLSQAQQDLVPSLEELENLFIHQYLGTPEMRDFLEEMASRQAQGYLRPFTVDEEQSIGVTHPGKPAIRAVACLYNRYLGEPFNGVVVPYLVRAVRANGTGWLKLGVNYLMSIKAIDLAREVDPEAAAALFLDDQLHRPLEERTITEWDSSCALFAFDDGSVVKIPESPLILPSITIKGIVAILQDWGVKVEERELFYGELLQAVKEKRLMVACSVGTAGILNRCQKLTLLGEKNKVLTTHTVREDHPLFNQLGEARERYWAIYQEKFLPPPGIKLYKYVL
jgi:branched-subunit amino acid aminotransferase/4-amino-4-deoxychorismate lyase